MFGFIVKTLIFTLAVGPVATASPPKTITLDLKLEANNHVITQPQVVVPLGKKSKTLTVMEDHSQYIIEVTPNRDVDQQVYLDFTLRKVSHGKMFLISHPRMITLLDQQATADEGDSATSGDKNVVLSVTPHLPLN